MSYFLHTEARKILNSAFFSKGPVCDLSGLVWSTMVYCRLYHRYCIQKSLHFIMSKRKIIPNMIHFLSFIVGFLCVIIDHRYMIYAENRTTRTCLYIVTFFFCEILAIFVVEVKLQMILSDDDATFRRSSLYWLEMFFFVTLMAFNTFNHLMLIYHTFYAVSIILANSRIQSTLDNLNIQSSRSLGT